MKHTYNNALFIILPNLTCYFKPSFQICTSDIWMINGSSRSLLLSKRADGQIATNITYTLPRDLWFWSKAKIKIKISLKHHLSSVLGRNKISLLSENRNPNRCLPQRQTKDYIFFAFWIPVHNFNNKPIVCHLTVFEDFRYKNDIYISVYFSNSRKVPALWSLSLCSKAFNPIMKKNLILINIYKHIMIKY